MNFVIDDTVIKMKLLKRIIYRTFAIYKKVIVFFEIYSYTMIVKLIAE